MSVYRIYVEKKPEFAVEAQSVLNDLQTALRLSVTGVRILNRYDADHLTEEAFKKAIPTVFSEPAVDVTYDTLPECTGNQRMFAAEYLPGQFDQRADSASECIQLLSQGERPSVRSARIYLLDGELSAEDLEAIKKYGYDVAVQKTDDEFLYQLTANVTDRFYKYLNTGTLKGTPKTFQMALAMAKGSVEDKFKNMHRTVTGVVGFANILDVYEYLGAANITVQNQFGFQYIKDFMGYNTIFLLSSGEIARGKVIATPVDNIVLYYVDPADSDFSKAGLVYTTAGEASNLIGFHTQGNYHTAVSESFAVMGMTLFAEYLDGISVQTITPGE